MLDSAGDWLLQWEKTTKTMIHNRLDNTHIFQVEKDLIILDWSLAAWNQPQHDLIDIIVNFPGDLTNDLIDQMCQAHYEGWNIGQESPNRNLWQTEFAIALNYYACYSYPLALLESSLLYMARLIHFHENLRRLLQWQVEKL